LAGPARSNASSPSGPNGVWRSAAAWVSWSGRWRQSAGPIAAPIFSPVAIGRLRQFIATRPELAHVELLDREASDLEDLPAGSVDTVILNSVVQYFPETRLPADRPRSRVQAGETRRAYLRRQTCVLSHSSRCSTVRSDRQGPARGRRRLAQAKSRASRSIGEGAGDRSAVLSRTLAIDSAHRRRGELLLKRGANEQTSSRATRYDVVLRVGDPEPPRAQSIEEWSAGGQTAGALVSRFTAQRLPAVRIVDVPNRRLTGDLAVVRRLASAR